MSTTDDCIAEGHDLGPGNCCDIDCPWSLPIEPDEPPTAQIIDLFDALKNAMSKGAK
jgi:hypothetical protein